MKIPKQSKPVRRAGFINRLNVKSANKVTPSMIDEESDEDIPDTEDEGDVGEDIDETSEEAFEGVDDAGEE